jgi:hypothetical protein
MIEWLAPWWLLGLLTLPLIWWLHRRPAQARATPVSSLLLWQGARAQGTAQQRRNKTDPLWWLRAAIITLLLAAAATPAWLTQMGPRIEVWFDDSRSMQTQESSGTRLQLATSTLLDKLDDENPSAVILHSLSQPGRQLLLQATERGHWRSAIDEWLQTSEQELQLPQAWQMARGSSHWLVSDGADPAYPDWLAQAPLAHVVQVGQANDNSAITRLSLRPALDDNRLEGMVIVTHQGDQTATRDLTIKVDDQPLQQWPLTLEGATSVRKSFVMPRRDGIKLSATLTPGDALGSDDSLELSATQTTPLAYALQGECNERLQTALIAHPMLRATADASQAALTLVCGAALKQRNNATLWFYRNQRAAPLNAAPTWQMAGEALSKIALPEQGLQYFVSQTEQQNEALLRAEDAVLIEQQKTKSNLVKVSLDMESPGLRNTTAYPLLILSLIDLAMERNLSDAIDTVQRNVSESDIAPHPLTIQRPQRATANVAGASPLAPWLIAAAIFLLIIDLLRRRRSPAYA